MFDSDDVAAQHQPAVEFEVIGVQISLRKGRTIPEKMVAAADRADAPTQLEHFVASCQDVEDYRFDRMTVQGHVGSKNRSVDVHAIVECRSGTFLINAYRDTPHAFWAGGLLEVAAAQLGFYSEVVTPMAMECSSPRFMTLLAVACQQYADLDDQDIDRIARVFETKRRPKLCDVHLVLGGASRGHTKALAAVAQGLLRLPPHTDLTPSVLVGPGPLLKPTRSPSGGAAGIRAAVQPGCSA